MLAVSSCSILRDIAYSVLVSTDQRNLSQSWWQWHQSIYCTAVLHTECSIPHEICVHHICPTVPTIPCQDMESKQNSSVHILALYSWGSIQNGRPTRGKKQVNITANGFGPNSRKVMVVRKLLFLFLQDKLTPKVDPWGRFSVLKTIFKGFKFLF